MLDTNVRAASEDTAGADLAGTADTAKPTRRIADVVEQHVWSCAQALGAACIDRRRLAATN